jgi:tol-pal system protein YbgF
LRQRAVLSPRAALEPRAAVNPRGAALLGAACIAAWALAGCASTPPDQDPVQIKLNDLDTRLARIERVVANQSLLDLANQIEAMRSDVRSLRNDIDELNHSQDATRKQQHDLYADLDQRLKVLEARGATAGAQAGAAVTGASAPGAPGSAASVVAAPPDVADKVSYQAAFDLLKDGQYDKAISAFQSFLVTYPNSQLADNAQYWLGEAYYVQKSFPEALAAFERMTETYPQSRKMPDAMLKIGYCDYELKQFRAARDALLLLTARFPDTPSAGLAKQRLDKMTSEQH